VAGERDLWYKGVNVPPDFIKIEEYVDQLSNY
jgi:hypothetical protein